MSVGVGLLASHAVIILGAFAQLQKVTISCAMSVCLSVFPPVCPSVRLSVRIEQLSSHWTNFHEIWYLSIFRISVEKIQVSLKCDKNNGYFTWDLYIYIYISSSSVALQPGVGLGLLAYIYMIIWRLIFLDMRVVSDKICKENQNTPFMLNISFLYMVPFMR